MIGGLVVLAVLIVNQPARAQDIPSTPLMGGPTQIADEVGRLLGMADACYVPIARREAMSGSTQALLTPRGVPEPDSLRMLRMGVGRGAIERNRRNLDSKQVRRAFAKLEADLARPLHR
ncbi:MAG: hypothetical protein EXQ87_08700 [Alphaproteobacteria bacterium]|nr:hypothetical protein [Alphaproteobacteria bacterium]